MLVSENHKTALSIQSMLKDLILFRAEKLQEHFMGDLVPFHGFELFDSYAFCMSGYLTDGHHWSIDIVVLENGYSFEFWDRNANNTSIARELLVKMDLNGYYENAMRMKKRFKFPEQEEELIGYVTNFKKKLIEATKPC